MKINDLLERQKDNEDVAIKHHEKVITYSAWYNKSIELTTIINATANETSHNISIFLPNSIDYAVAYFAIVFADKVIIPIGVQSMDLEFCSTLEYCEVDVIISSLQYRTQIERMLCDYKYRCNIIYIENFEISTIHNKKNYILKTQVYDDVVIMLHTSGTTNNPKRVMLTHQNLISNVESNISSLKLDKKDKVLIALPMYFGYCNTAQFLTHLYLGASMVIMHSMFLPKQFFEIIQQEKITNFTAVPSMLLMIMEYRYSNNYNTSSLRYICFGGSSFSSESIQKLIKQFDHINFVQTYGQTEASPRITTLLPDHAVDKCGSVGTPIPNVQLKIVDEEGNCIKPYETGEVIVCGKNVMRGYYKQEEITNKTIVNSWLHTGDLGYLDKDGFLYICGRKKNMIISGGINIYPEELEEIIQQYDCVKEVCVISEVHKLLGEVPIAKVVLKENEECTQSEIRNYCTSKLAHYKVPFRFDFVRNIDKTYNGKVRRY